MCTEQTLPGDFAAIPLTSLIPRNQAIKNSLLPQASHCCHQNPYLFLSLTAPNPGPPLHQFQCPCQTFPVWLLLQEASQAPASLSEYLLIYFEFPDLGEGEIFFSQTADKLLEGSNQGILFPPFPLATSMGLVVPAPTQPLPFPQKPPLSSQVVGLGDQHSQLLDAVVDVEPPSPFN